MITREAKFPWESVWSTYEDHTIEQAAVAHSKTEYEPLKQMDVLVREQGEPDTERQLRVLFEAKYTVLGLRGGEA